MGKAQSKRSVDITTETKKGIEDEITEKMGKIEDLDNKEVLNGDATLSEKSDQEKKENEDGENDKDMTTEKDVDIQASGDVADPQNIAYASKDEGGSATAEEISPLSDESIKKSKKEKVKKKWSFRSISFGKKDKQKPSKGEDVAEDGSAVINGAENDDKTNEPEDTQKDKTAFDKEEKTTETRENGNATPRELNGDEQNENLSDEKSIDITANIKNTTTTETYEPVQNETAAVSTDLSEKTENTAIVNETKTSENDTVNDVLKNGNEVDEKSNTTEEDLKKIDVTNATAEALSEKTCPLASAVTNESSAKTNGEVVDQIHQNGDHDECEQAVTEKSKAQIEVNSNTDNNVSAATLDSISTTFINPSNVQIHAQDLNASSEKPDEINQINNDETILKKSTDSEHNKCPNIDQTLLCENANIVEDQKPIQVNEASGSLTEAIEKEKSSHEKLGVDSSPPPLPISPPPSQVSVFAFTNNEESVEDSIQTKHFEPAINNLNKEESKIVPSLLSNLPATEIISSHEIQLAPVEVFGGEIASQERDLQIAASPNTDVKNQCQESEIQEKENICEEDELPPSSVSEKSQIEEDVSVAFAATVIVEITETAAEIVNQQLECDKNQLTDTNLSQNYEKKTEDEVYNKNVIQNYNNKAQSDEIPVDVQEIVCEDVKSSNDLSLVVEQIKNMNIECSIDFTVSDSIHQNQDEMNSLKKSNNLDEDHLDPTKEFAKDNVTVAEITQELSVTCE